MNCPICKQPMQPYGSPHPRDGQLFACLTHRGYGAYADELRAKGHGAAVDAALQHNAEIVEAGRQQWAEEHGFSSFEEANAAAAARRST